MARTFAAAALVTPSFSWLPIQAGGPKCMPVQKGHTSSAPPLLDSALT